MAAFEGPPLSSEAGLGALTLPGFLEEVVTRYAEREALCFPDPDGSVVRWSYEDLGAQARRVARALVAQGMRPGSRVALLMGNRPEWVAVTFGVALAGGVSVPINTIFEAPELAYVLSHSASTLLFYERRLGHHDYEAALDAHADALGSLERRVCWGTEDAEVFLAAGDAVETSALTQRVGAVAPADDALIIYTSGTTAKPKGVLHSHQAPCIQSWRFAQQLRLDETDRVWSAFPFFWTAGFCMVMGATLAAGGCLVLEELFEPGEALALLESERVTTPHSWPHQVAALESHPDWAKRDFSAIRHVQSFTVFARHPSVRPQGEWSPRSAYGLTETFTIVSSVPADTPPTEREGHEGVILGGNSIRIVDPETGADQPAGAAGEIRAKGPTLMKGYLGVELAEVLDDQGYFPSGDAGFVDEAGHLHWTGRTSDMIKTGGANVSPVEIETELLQLASLETALAVGVPDPVFGQLVVLCAVVKSGHTVSEQDVKDFLCGRIARYKVPRRVLFFEHQDLTMTGNAKIRTDDLRALAIARLAAQPSP